MNVVIKESGLDFGKYEKSDLFHMEESLIYKSIKNGIRTVEFILRHKNDGILLLEAKSSSPKPGNQEKFDDFIDDVYRKFSHSADLYFSIVLKRIKDRNNEMPEYFKSADYSTVKITLLLVINGHEIEWLPPICDALRVRLRRQIKTWQLGLVVINQKQASEYGLLR
jgi:hypothetical protein